MIYLGADHRGFELKEKIKGWLTEWEQEFKDMGNTVYDKQDDFPDYAGKVAEAVSQGDGKGVVLCGSGVGVDIVANKYKGVMSMAGLNKDQVEHGVEREHVNVLSLAVNHVSEAEAREMVKVFLTTKPGKEERFLRRIGKIKKLEEKNFK